MRFLLPVVLALGLPAATFAADADSRFQVVAATFSASLSAPDAAAAGLNKLTSAELDRLDACVAREVSLARAGNVHAFAGTFLARRTDEERQAIGAERLTPAEKTSLDSLVAVAISTGTASTGLSHYSGKSLNDVLHRLEVHGEVSVMVGSSGGGRNFYGTSFFTTVSDPATGITVGFGYEDFHGKGCVLPLAADDYPYSLSEPALRRRASDFVLSRR